MVEELTPRIGLVVAGCCSEQPNPFPSPNKHLLNNPCWISLYCFTYLQSKDQGYSIISKRDLKDEEWKDYCARGKLSQI